jgi:hypothetical protein
MRMHTERDLPSGTWMSGGSGSGALLLLPLLLLLASDGSPTPFFRHTEASASRGGRPGGRSKKMVGGR